MARLRREQSRLGPLYVSDGKARFQRVLQMGSFRCPQTARLLVPVLVTRTLVESGLSAHEVCVDKCPDR